MILAQGRKVVWHHVCDCACVHAWQQKLKAELAWARAHERGRSQRRSPPHPQAAPHPTVRTLSALNSSIPGPFLQLPPIAVSAFASTDQ